MTPTDHVGDDPVPHAGGGSQGLSTARLTGLLNGTYVRFLSPSGDTTGVTDTAAIQAAINTAETAGGGKVILATGTWYVTGGITLKTKVWLVGSGMYATTLFLAAGSNATVVRAYTSPDGVIGNAVFCAVLDLTIDGNRANQTSGTCHGIDLTAVTSTGDISFDAHHLIQNVRVRKTRSRGVESSNAKSECRFINVHVQNAGNNSFNAGQDSFYTNCTSDNCSADGFRITHGNVMLVGCKSFFSGMSTDVAHATAAGYSVTGTNNRVTLVGCIAQNNAGEGYFLASSTITAQGCISDSNNMLESATSTTKAGVTLSGCTYSVIDIACYASQYQGGVLYGKQFNALRVDANTKNCVIRITQDGDRTDGTSTALIGPGISSDSSIDTSNTINVNGSVESAANAPTLAVPPASVNHPSNAAWPAANTALFARFSLPAGGTFRYPLWAVGTQSGSVQVGVVKLSGTGMLTYTRVMDSGVIACPVAGNVRSDLGATRLSPGDYALFVWADNITFQMRWLSNAGLSALRYAGAVTGLASGVPASGTLTWGTQAPEIVLEGNTG